MPSMKNQEGAERTRRTARVRTALKNTLVDSVTVAKICADNDFCPFEEMIRLIRETRSDYVKAQCLIDLGRYIHPHLKSIEVKQSKTEPFIFNINI